jgi:isopenicillin N synthase-like dioxygenase
MSRSTESAEDLIVAQKIDLTEVPLIDFAPFRNGGEAGKQLVAAQIADACNQIGFFYLKGHGVPEQVSRNAFAESANFYHRPEAERERSAASPSWYRGWIAKPRAKGLSRDSRLFEQYRIQAEKPPNDGGPGSTVFYRPNRWPDDMPAFRTACDAYYAAMLALSDDLLHAFAIGLGLPENRLDDYFHNPLCQLSLLYYTPLPDEADLSVSNTVAHTDEGPFTILAQDTVGGLEVKRRDGVWIAAPPIPGAFTINVGDMLMWWSNGRYLSNSHRVRNKSKGERFSIPFFNNPDRDVIVAPLPELVAQDGGVVRYPPVHVGTHLSRFYATLEKQALDAVTE